MTTTTTKMMNMGEERRRVILSSNPPCSRRFVGRRPPVGMFPSRPHFRPLDSNLRCDERARFSFAFGVSYLTLRSFVRSFGRSFVCLFFRHEKLRARHVERWEAHDADRPEQRSGEIRPRDARQVRRAGEDLGRGVRRRSARNIIIAHFYPPTLSSPPPTPSPTSISLVLSTPPPPARRTSERTI
jgi:hypothetical protein